MEERSLKGEKDQAHQSVRDLLRVVGPFLLVIGAIFAVVGFADFFSAFGGNEPPRLFWCIFVGFVLFAIGAPIVKFAFLGSVSRYVVNEVAPVGRDAFNYMAGGTKDAVRDLASAVGEGLRGGGAAEVVEVIRCHKCNVENERTAKFCKDCGAALSKTKPCAGCGELNDPDSRFCDNCGKPMQD